MPWAFFWDYWIYWVSGIILIPGLIVSIWAQVRVNKTFAKYRRISGVKRITGAEFTRKMLNDNELYDVQITSVRGHLTDHYDPRSKTIALSQDVASGDSLAALGVAAHEAGHAVQYKTGYLPIKLRTALVPVLNFASALMWPMMLVGMLLSFAFVLPGIGDFIILAAAGVYGLSVLFQLITLPVEYNASRRAYKSLISTNALGKDEAKGAKKVLNAAALTYVAALLTSILSLLRFVVVILASRSRNRR